MKTNISIQKNDLPVEASGNESGKNGNDFGKRFLKISSIALMVAFATLFTQCSKDDNSADTTDITDTTENEYPPIDNEYTIEQAISDRAQLNTIAFDGLAFMVGNLGGQSFLPPGKVADYSGFQCFRDNDPTNLGHNTDFVTIIAFNMLSILNEDQIGMFVESANNQIDLINEFAYTRFPLLKAYRRLLDGDLPTGTTGLDKDAVMAYTAELYQIDGQISYNRAQLFGEVVSSLTTAQKTQIQELIDHRGAGNWTSNIPNPLEGMNLDRDISVAVMTYASEMYAWYAGNTTTDVYFCPERHGTYFGSFYLKDWPVMGHPGVTIDEALTANAGGYFLSILNSTQSEKINNIVNLQKTALNTIVAKRTSISKELRKFLKSQTADATVVNTLSEEYGASDGELSYYMAVNFAEVYHSLSDEQKIRIDSLATALLYEDITGAFLYSERIDIPEIVNTDFLFK